MTSSLLEQLQPPAPDRRVWLFAMGKAAHGMATAMSQWLGPASPGRVSGIVVSTHLPDRHLPGVAYVLGDHPVPGDKSLRAADALGHAVSGVQAGDQVYVLISGGTTSLIGAPVDRMSPGDYRRTFEMLLGSGLDIDEINAVRRRMSRWADGRLALALRHAMVQPIIISDVMSDDPATIGSGPCTSGSRADMRSLTNVATPLLASHKLALHAALTAARQRGLRPEEGPRLSGEARECGRRLGERLMELGRSGSLPTVVICGGETTVTLGTDQGTGGRCQELVLSAAEALAGAPDPTITLLAAGTDGRDGPTDAAGAIVDGDSWRAMIERGRDPAADLARHNAYEALDSVGALLRTGPTGTNMLDLAVAAVGPAFSFPNASDYPSAS